jgi:hypothetical protein
MKLALILLAGCLLAPAVFAAAPPRCVRGGPEGQMDLWDGYSVVVGAPADASKKDQCRVAVVAPGGKTLFEATDSEASVNAVTGQDVDQDGKPDVVVETRGPRGKCCYNYYVISLAPPAVARSFSVSVPLTFEDRDGDGKVEIWGRDNAFDSVDGLSTTDSPYPKIFFRLKGSRLYDVSPAFSNEYDADINLARGQISQRDLDDMLKAEAGPDDQEGGGRKPLDPKDPKNAEYQHIRGLVLQITLDYLYSGRGMQAWETIKDMWRDNDKARIRQVILQGRSRGILSEINRQPDPPASSGSTNP